ncbi:unnamed protein product [Hermetia illucens]|uniref:Uncharacterized protein n=1 Tax=Hermetia illucens TaxID=343691 RepID=A0A7R8UJW5_HERIL|nr:uncharacterized protein LOC119649804 [Hermetia illucens]CAD7082220.1 unnamed protein product [Hermetia illucens]
MRFLAIFLLPLFVSSAFAISACGVCGVHSGAMCMDDATFSFCDHASRALPGRHSCPTGMVCADNFTICVNATTIPKGAATCETKCGKCSATNRFACRSSNTFSLCYGNEQPSDVEHRCPTNQICSTTKDPSSKQFCFDPVTLNDEDISCFDSSRPSSVFARFIAAAK